MIMEAAKPRINGQMMEKYQGKTVCLLGSVTDVDSSGMSFKLKASDGDIIVVNLQEPHQDCLTGFIEVQGKVTSKMSLLCNSYVLFPPEHTQTFDISPYNEVISLMHEMESA